MLLTRRELGIIAALYLVSRLALLLLGAWFVSRTPDPPGEQFTHLLDGGPALDMWYRWDAGFYATIATDGYKWFNERRIDGDLAFLPGYPLLVHLASGGGTCALSPYRSTCATIGGVLVSNMALLAAVVLIADLAKRRYDSGAGLRAAALTLFAPNAIFLAGVYTEATFLLLAAGVFWLLHQQRYAWAVLLAGLAALTRSVGVAFVPALLWHAWRQRSVPAGLAALLPALAFGGYILFAGAHIGDAGAYFAAYSGVWERPTRAPWETISAYFTRDDVALLGWEYAWIDLVFTALYLALGVALLRIDVGWGLFALFAILIPIASGSLVSVPRYGAVIAPFYIALAMWARGWPRFTPLLAGNGALAILFLMRFVTWRWIA
jgi:hypothetical protein